MSLATCSAKPLRGELPADREIARATLTLSKLQEMSPFFHTLHQDTIGKAFRAKSKKLYISRVHSQHIILRVI